jgi:hypothetical protein
LTLCGFTKEPQASNGPTGDRCSKGFETTLGCGSSKQQKIHHSFGENAPRRSPLMKCKKWNQKRRIIIDHTHELAKSTALKVVL